MKKVFDYKTAMKRLRGKVTFNYDLRQKLSPYKKRRIKKAFESAIEFGIKRDSSKASFVHIKRKRGESKKNYSIRLEEIKRNMGQGGTTFKGVFTDAPVHLKDVHYSFKGNKLTITRPKFGYVEKWEDIDPLEVAKLGYAAIAGIILEYKDLGFTRVQMVSNGAYRSGESIALWRSEDFIAGIFEARLNQYSDFESWLTGLIFTKHTN